jgi:hypothetical protein
MDHIWHMESMDLRMTPYTSVYWVPRGYDRNAKTDYQIQRQAAIQVNSTQLYEWIRENNRNKNLAQAIETFSLSCM